MIYNNKESSEQTEKESFSDLWDKAQRLLVRREYSRFELGRKLGLHGDPGTVEEVLVSLSEQGLQSDMRFAEMICRTRFSRGKGPIKIRHELQENRISPELVEEVMSEYEGQWSDLAVKVRTSKFGCQPPTTYKEWAKQARFLQQRGFSAEQIGSFEGG